MIEQAKGQNDPLQAAGKAVAQHTAGAHHIVRQPPNAGKHRPVTHRLKAHQIGHKQNAEPAKQQAGTAYPQQAGIVRSIAPAKISTPMASIVPGTA